MPRGESEKKRTAIIAANVFPELFFVILKRKNVDAICKSNIKTLPELSEAPNVKNPTDTRVHKAINIHPAGA